jgi:cytochrome c
MNRQCLGLFIAYALLEVFPAHAAPNSAAISQRAGEIFATDNCAQCHAIGKLGFSPYAKAPPFRVVANKYKLEYLQEALAEGILTGHNTMPEFILSPRQIDDLLAYLQTLK